MRFLLPFLLLLLSAPARAQTADTPALPPGQAAAITDVRFGWQNAIIPERWNPIRVFITGGDKGFSGLLITEFNQDASQAARIVTPAAATPGRTTPIDLAAALPGSFERIEFTLISDTGLEIQRLTFDHLPGPRELDLDPVRLFDQGLILSLGQLSVSSAFDAVPDKTPPSAIAPPDPDADPDAEFSFEVPRPLTGEDLATKRWADLKLSRLEPGSLPFLWTAYDSAQALIIRTESAADADPRAIDAVKAWVRSGGRLILIVDTPGPRWRRWLPDGPAGELITVSEVLRTPLPATISAAIDAAEDAQPAPAAQARALRLTARGEAEAWSLDWPLETSDAGPAGLIAQGPVGFGWVVVVGIEPQACLQSLSKPGLTAVWRQVLDDPLAPWLQEPRDDSLQFMRFSGAASGASARARQALSQILDLLTDAAPLGAGVIAMILGGMLLLTLLVGPIDALALRRLRLRQHSWLTALGWITLMSLIAYAVPPLVRTGPDVIHRLRITDIIADPDAGPGGGLAWNSGVTTLFASRAGPINLEPFDPGVWWRGVSAAYAQPGGRRLLPPFPTRIDTGGPGGQELRGAAPAGLTQGQWTIRAVTDDGPARADLSARLRRVDDHWQITLIGVPPQARISQCDLTIAGTTHLVQWSSASAPATESSLRIWRGRSIPVTDASREPRSARPDDAPTDDEPLAQVGQTIMTARVAAALDPAPLSGPAFSPDSIPLATALELPGAADRSPSIKFRADSSRWAQLRLLATGLPPAYPAAGQARQTSSAVYRLLIPIDPDAADLPEDAE
ncbi:MAG: hypothetical protein IT436_11935 [Phycisphaerales bacterium]|nr:hypothetical protein [Phycisphaerales bacterium]